MAPFRKVLAGLACGLAAAALAGWGLTAQADPAPAPSAPAAAQEAATDLEPVEVGGGPNRFRMPRAYIVLAPDPRNASNPQDPNDGVNLSIIRLQAVLPGMAPVGEGNRAQARPVGSDPASRLAVIHYEARQALPAPAFLEGLAREAARHGATVEEVWPFGARWQILQEVWHQGVVLGDFSPASPATMGLRVWMGRNPGGDRHRKADLFWADLPGRGFVGAVCRGNMLFQEWLYYPETCSLYMDWRGALVRADVSRVWLGEWRAVASGALDLLDRFAVEPPHPAR